MTDNPLVQSIAEYIHERHELELAIAGTGIGAALQGVPWSLLISVAAVAAGAFGSVLINLREKSRLSDLRVIAEQQRLADERVRRCLVRVAAGPSDDHPIRDYRQRED